VLTIKVRTSATNVKKSGDKESLSQTLAATNPPPKLAIEQDLQFAPTNASMHPSNPSITEAFYLQCFHGAFPGDTIIHLQFEKVRT